MLGLVLLLIAGSVVLFCLLYLIKQPERREDDGGHYEGCECGGCLDWGRRSRASAAGPHECRFSSGEEWPEHCVICGLAVNDPRRHRFLRKVEVQG